jgi:putative flippase GtrA
MQGKRLLTRWLSFNSVGAIGVAVQLSVLALLVHVAGLHYLAATAIAVETAVLHNFIWHQRWTWRDRPSTSAFDVVGRLARFHLLNGAVSMVGNLGIMTILTGTLRIEPLLANVVAIATCSLVNFVASELLVFRTSPLATALMTVAIGSAALPAPARGADLAAELTAAALAAWQRYEQQVDDRYQRAAAAADPFFAQDAFKQDGWRPQVKAGRVSMTRIESASPGIAVPSVPDAKIHHWAGAIAIPNVSIDDVLRHLRDRAGRESESYADVIASQLLARDGDRIRVYMKLRRDSVITVTYNTEHTVDYRTLGRTRASSRSVATKIAELTGVGTSAERERPAGSDRGFLWRLNAYWRFEQVDDAVVIECESVSLSRGVPALLRPFVTGTVERIARESLQSTLESLRAELTRSLARPSGKSGR